MLVCELQGEEQEISQISGMPECQAWKYMLKTFQKTEEQIVARKVIRVFRHEFLFHAESSTLADLQRFVNNSDHHCINRLSTQKQHFLEEKYLDGSSRKI